MSDDPQVKIRQVFQYLSPAQRVSFIQDARVVYCLECGIEKKGEKCYCSAEFDE